MVQHGVMEEGYWRRPVKPGHSLEETGRRVYLEGRQLPGNNSGRKSGHNNVLQTLRCPGGYGEMAKQTS